MSNPSPDNASIFGRFADALESDWASKARQEQLPPAGSWHTWCYVAGRGAGKTRSGAEWIRARVEAGIARRVHLIAPTAADCRDVMVEGESGIIATAPNHFRPTYYPSLRKVEWPNGAIALLFSSDEPDRLRGPQCDSAWIDELCAMRQPTDTLDMCMFGLRLGANPQCLITTTPRPIKCLKDLLAREGQDVVVTRSSTFANAKNLAKPFLDSILRKYAGTRLGAQELEATILDDTPGALWSWEVLDAYRVKEPPATLRRVVVAIDPAVTSGEDADETGIVVCGVGEDGHGYVLDDRSGRYAPEEWAKEAVAAYRRHRADSVVAEANQGGELVSQNLKAIEANLPVKLVHASRGKVTRADPISTLYARGRVHHVGVFADLESQMTSFTPDFVRSRGNSPDRVDALVWGLTECALDGGDPYFLTWIAREAAKLNAVAVEAASRGRAAFDAAVFDNTVPGRVDPKMPVVKMRAPPTWCGTVFLRNGAKGLIDPDGILAAHDEDVAALRSIGFLPADAEAVAP